MQDTWLGGQSGAQATSRLARMCDAVVRWTLLALAFLVPILYLPWTSDVLELHKQMFVLIGGAVVGLAWMGKMLADRKFEYRRSPVNAMVVLFLAAYTASTIMSQSRYVSLFGDFGQEKAGLFTVYAFAVIYFATSSTIREIKDLRRYLGALIAGGFVVSVFSLLQALGLYIAPSDFTKTPSFNTVGSVGSLAVYLSLIVSLCGGALLIGHRQTDDQRKKALVMKIAVAVTAALALFLVAVIDFQQIWWALLASSAVLIAFAFFHAGQMKGIRGVLLPIITFVMALLLLYFRFPFTVGYPSEVMPSLSASRDVAMHTLREHPMFGSGPGTFLYDYAKFHSADISQSVFWNVRFDRSASRFWTMVATTGLIGGIAWLMMALFLLFATGKKLVKTEEDTWHVVVGVFAAWTLLLVSRFTYSSSMTLEFMFWFMMAMLVAVLGREFYTVKLDSSPRASMSLAFAFIVSLALVFAGGFVQSQRYAAELAYSKAIAADKADGSGIGEVVSDLERAVTLNPDNDVYRRNLALAYLNAADAESKKTVKVTDAKDQKDKDEKTKAAEDDKRKKVTTLTANAVNTAKSAADVNPANVANWSALGSVYQTVMTSTAGADAWAVAAFQKAVELEPANPVTHTELGKVYIFQADLAAQAKAATKDDKEKAGADANMNELLSKASDEFGKAIELKPDYAPAHYQLALVLDRQNKLKEAIAKMESVLSANPQDVGVGLQLSLLYYRDGRKDDAVKLLESVVKFAPQYADAHWMLSAMYEASGNLDGAITQAGKVLELNPDNADVKARVDALNAKKAGAPAPAPGTLPAPPDSTTKNPQEPSVKR